MSNKMKYLSSEVALNPFLTNIDIRVKASTKYLYGCSDSDCSIAVGW